MKPSHFLLIITVGVCGFVLGIEVEKQNKYEELLWYSYEKSANSIKHHTHILENIRTGETNKSISHLEHLLDASASIVSGCYNDLCKGEKRNEFEVSMKLYNEYKAIFPNENTQQNNP